MGDGNPAMKIWVIKWRLEDGSLQWKCLCDDGLWLLHCFQWWVIKFSGKVVCKAGVLLIAAQPKLKFDAKETKGKGFWVAHENAGLLASTRVGSRRVVQISAGFMLFFSVLGEAIWTISHCGTQGALKSGRALKPRDIIIRAGCYKWYQSGTPPVGVVRGRTRRKLVGL
ncbi:hypothetical protein ACLOJK_004082 [Asimina triloba]